MKKLVLVMTIMFMAMICVSFAGNVMASDQPAAAAGEEITTDDAAQVAVDTEEPLEAEAYSAPEGEDAEADMSEEAPADSDAEMQE